MDVSCRQNMRVGSPPRIWSAIYRKRIEADVVARPAGTLEARTFSTATRAACTGAQLVAGSTRPPSDDGDRTSKGSVVLAALTPQPYPGGQPLEFAERRRRAKLAHGR